jgi:16S rRNA (guanine(527)-N(7))-methyltransferase GidB
MNLGEKLEQGLAALAVPLPAGAGERLLAYITLLHKWNKVYNLTAIREPQQMLSHHILDSLAVLPYLPQAKSIADVGTGAGLPGIPLALARPETAVALVESNHKKATFLTQAKLELKLDNVQVICERAEAFQPVNRFGVVVSRAFSDLADFVGLTRHLCAPGGVLAAMKGLYPHEELAALPSDVTVEQVFPVKVPGLEAERHLVLIRVD